MIRWRALLMILLAISSLAALTGCEDDPLLDGPENGAAAGSYGRLSMPDSTGRYAPAPTGHEGNTAVF